jgi:hypothetical protein
VGPLCAAAAALVALVNPTAGTAVQQRCAERPARHGAVHAARHAPRDTLAGALRGAHRAGLMSWRERRRDERALRRARRHGGRELANVLALADRLAAERRLPVGRLRAVMATIDHNRRARPGPALARRKAGGLVWQERPPYGWQVHPLASAGRLNAVVSARRRGAIVRVADALIARGNREDGALRFEYLFPFGTGDPPWTSAMAQATAAQALARAYHVAHRRRFLQAARGAYRAMTAAAVRAPGGRVERFAMYSFARDERILNGELQMLVALHDYARIASDARAERLFVRLAGDELDAVGRYDTGAWTLYDAGGREASLHYHALATRFAGALCRRGERLFCPVHARFARYLREPAALTLRVGRRGRARRSMGLFVAASKPATATLAVIRIDGLIVLQRRVSLGRGGISLRFTPPRRGRYTVALWATALNGKASTRGTSLTVAPSAKRRRGGRSRR